MKDEQLFRLILLAGFAILLPIGIFHRLKSRTGEKLDRRQEGLFILVTLRLCGITGMLGVLLYLINPAWMAWAALPLPAWLRWTGAGFGVISELLFIWTLRNLGKNLTDTVVTRQLHTLVTTGPYRWIRHPFYTAAALMIPANFLLAANWFFLAIGVAVFLLLAIRTRKEEENLIARFGDDYRNYMQRTGRFAPRSLRRFVLVGGVVLAVAAGHYLINRLFSPRNAVSVRTIQAPGFSPDARFDGTLKFAAFNIAHGRGTNEGNLSHRAGRRARLKAIAELLQQHQVDIAVLNEVGDFNCSPASAEIESTSREPSAMAMLLKHGRLKIVPANRLTRERFSFASFAPTVAIDWGACSHGLGVHQPRSAGCPTV